MAAIAVSEVELLLAYEMALASLPRREEWSATVSKRTDGSSADGIFSVLEALRAEFYSRLGEKVAPTHIHSGVIGNCLASSTDMVSAYELAASSLPRGDQWYRAVARRTDGVSAEQVFHVLGTIRAELHEAIGNGVADSACCGRACPF